MYILDASIEVPYRHTPQYKDPQNRADFLMTLVTEKNQKEAGEMAHIADAKDLNQFPTATSSNLQPPVIPALGRYDSSCFLGHLQSCAHTHTHNTQTNKTFNKYKEKYLARWFCE